MWWLSWNSPPLFPRSIGTVSSSMPCLPRCLSAACARWPNGICNFGVENLVRLAAFPHFFFNRFWPAFDFGALLCVYERLFNMTHLHTCGEQLDKMAPVVNKSFVQQLPNVRWFGVGKKE
ncbi:hypothetical protein niasHT_023925 [Heterodera trifolii]|uniref:Secreted protein n=1 Tax=Heterodera trifolii TaxID=157864 RepID=A0ABD2JVD8_9BILA